MGGASDDNIVTSTTNDFTISDMHFTGIEGYAINLADCDNVVIERCTFDHVGAAIRLSLCNNVTVRDCAFYNIMGPRGAFVNAGVFVQAIQCDGIVVEDCWGVNDFASNQEDVLSMYQSVDVIFRRNRLWGSGPSLSGTAINLGDGGGCSYGQAIDNVLIETGAGGVSITGGDFMTATGNKIMATRGKTDRGGIVVNNFYDSNCSAITVTNNSVNWIGTAGAITSLTNVDDDCGTVVNTGNDWSASVTIDDWTPTGYFGWE